MVKQEWFNKSERRNDRKKERNEARTVEVIILLLTCAINSYLPDFPTSPSIKFSFSIHNLHLHLKYVQVAEYIMEQFPDGVTGVTRE